MSSPNGHTPMIGELLAEIFGEAAFGRLGRSRRAQLIARLLIGLLGTGLCGFGAIHFLLRANLTNNPALRTSMVAVFVFLACFSLFNVALARKWPAPTAVHRQFRSAVFSRILLERSTRIAGHNLSLKLDFSVPGSAAWLIPFWPTPSPLKCARRAKASRRPGAEAGPRNSPSSSGLLATSRARQFPFVRKCHQRSGCFANVPLGPDAADNSRW